MLIPTQMYENGFGDQSLFKVTNYNVQFKYQNILVYLYTLSPEISLFMCTLCHLKYPCLFVHSVSWNIHVYLYTPYPEISMFICTLRILKYPCLFVHSVSWNIHVYQITIFKIYKNIRVYQNIFSYLNIK